MFSCFHGSARLLAARRPDAFLAGVFADHEALGGILVGPDVGKGVIDSTAALEGARAILIKRFAEDATLIGTLREEVWSRGRLCSRVRAGKAEPGADGGRWRSRFGCRGRRRSRPGRRIGPVTRNDSALRVD
jgi:transcriptional accessory protein Tex/SPT6